MALTSSLARLREPLTSVSASLGFYSRLPVARIFGNSVQQRGFDVASDIGLVPVTGALIGLLAAAALELARGLGLAMPLAALAAIATLVLVTGGLHEDGLADVADGFGGGRDRASKLSIMKDSRIGTFGALALGLGLAARVMAVAAIAHHSLSEASLVLIGAGSVSRFGGLMPMIMLKPAREDGLGAGVTRPSAAALRLGAALSLVAALLPMLAAAGFGASLAAMVLALLGQDSISRLASRHIGGQTGDVAGAAQQCAEIGFLLGFALKIGG